MMAYGGSFLVGALDVMIITWNGWEVGAEQDYKVGIIMAEISIKERLYWRSVERGKPFQAAG